MDKQRLHYNSREGVYQLLDEKGEVRLVGFDNWEYKELLEERLKDLRVIFLKRNLTRTEYFELSTLVYDLERVWELKRFEFATQLPTDED